jgi:alpha-maltose-1-phosphate synthase
MSVIVSNPTANANVRNLVTALFRAQLLCRFYTTIAVFDSALCRFVSMLPGLNDVRRRFFPDDLKSFTKTSPIGESIRLFAQKAGLRLFLQHEAGFFCIDKIGKRLDRKVSRALSRSGSSAVYCYEDFALQTFASAKQQGIARIYEHPVAYWRVVRKIMEEEVELHPEWAATIPGLRNSDRKLHRKDAELSYANRIVVASTFSRHTLSQCPLPLAPISVIPYGAPAVAANRYSAAMKTNGNKLKVIFVGGLGQLKGLSYLFGAIKQLEGSVELTLIGRKHSADRCSPLDLALKEHRWLESVPHSKVLEEMRAHDVLVFPSLSEGFGMVITEALSQGLPVITTPHTCGPDVLTEGEDGFIVPIRNEQSIAEKLELLHRDRGRLVAMSQAASKKADSLTWESYHRSIVSVVQETLAQRGS